ncbi:MAG TPA: RraA family protein [Alphaproteobacteria bacterium]
MVPQERQLTGRIARDRIRLMAVPRLPDDIVAGFTALGDATGIVSDTLDELGLPGAVAASTFRPTVAGARVVGPALTVRNVIGTRDPVQAARDHVNGMAEFEAHNLAQPGDVLVIDGVAGISNMGGISAQIAKRQGKIGAIVVRDVAHSREIGYPVWSTEVTPLTGKWRIETVEINGVVEIGGVRVAAGDLVLADDTGICFVPRDHVAAVLRIATRKAAGEAARCGAIARGVPLPELPRTTSA